MTRAAFLAQAAVIGADPERAAELHAQAQRIGRDLKHRLARLKTPAARQRVLQIANALIDAAVAETFEEAMARAVAS